MVDFSHLVEDVGEKKLTAVYTFEEIKGQPWIECKPATVANSKYYNALMRSMRRRGFRGNTITAKEVEKARVNDTRLLSEHCAIRWGNITDKSNKSVPFSQENCRQFLDQIRGRVEEAFDAFRTWATDPASFRDGDDDEGGDLPDDSDETLAGN